MTSETNIFGISLLKLMELGEEEVVDFESISSPPFDFHLKLPEAHMRPFVFDSKIFLAGDYLYSEPDDHVLSYKFYQLFFEDVDDDNNKLRISEAALDTIPPPPTHVAYSFIANIAGEVYLLVYDGKWTRIPRDEGFWVLRSGEWQPLQDPPPLHEGGFAGSGRFFVHQEKFFLEAGRPRQSHLYVFDPRTDTWTEVEDNIKNSFDIWDHGFLYLPSIAVSLPDVCNCTVTLFWKTEATSPRPYHKRVNSLKIYAVLLNNQDNSVYCYQSLDECSNAIKPTSFDMSRVVFVDLGNGLVCALVTGRVREYLPSSLLCVLVFALSLAQEFGTDAPGKEKRFLNVDRVLVNRVFSMQEYNEGYATQEMQHAIIFPPMEELLPPKKCLATPKV